jgi:hypothetical protein
VPETPEPSVPSTDKLSRLITFLDRALADLDAGKLAEMGNLIEEARRELVA